MNLQGLTTETRTAGKVTFVKLPRELWRLIDPTETNCCACPGCKNADGSLKSAYWDTLVIPHNNGAKTYTCHYPEL